MSNLGCDIEDISVDDSEQVVQPIPQIRIVCAFEKHPDYQNYQDTCAESQEIDVADGCIIPEKYKLWIITFGCAHNFADGEYMKVLEMVVIKSVGNSVGLWVPFCRKPR